MTKGNCFLSLSLPPFSCLSLISSITFSFSYAYPLTIKHPNEWMLVFPRILSLAQAYHFSPFVYSKITLFSVIVSTIVHMLFLCPPSLCQTEPCIFSIKQLATVNVSVSSTKPCLICHCISWCLRMIDIWFSFNKYLLNCTEQNYSKIFILTSVLSFGHLFTPAP